MRERREGFSLILLLLWFMSLKVDGQIILPTASLTVPAGNIGLFKCSAEGFYHGLPVWVINDTSYHHNQLPADHWFNQSGLVVLATSEKNGWSYSCVFTLLLDSNNNNGFTYTVIRSKQVNLIVTQATGNTNAVGNALRGPNVLEMQASLSGQNWKAHWRSTPSTVGQYRMKYFTCNATSVADIAVTPSCRHSAVAGLGMTGNKLLEVQICLANDNCGFQPPAGTQATIEPQNVVGINYGSNSFVPTESPVNLTPQQAMSSCIFTSKLTSVCNITEIYLEVFTTNGGSLTYNAVELLHSSPLFQTRLLNGSNNDFKLCMAENVDNVATAINGLFGVGSLNHVTIQERCLLRPCPTRSNLYASYYGKKARIVFSESAVLPTVCSFSLSGMAMSSELVLSPTMTSSPRLMSISSTANILLTTYATTSTMTDESSSVVASQVQPSSTPTVSGVTLNTALPGAIAVITIPVLLVIAAITIYVTLGIVFIYIYCKRKRQKWSPGTSDDEGDEWSTHTPSTTASSSRNIFKYDI